MLVEEDPFAHYSDTLASYYMAEGLPPSPPLPPECMSYKLVFFCLVGEGGEEGWRMGPFSEPNLIGGTQTRMGERPRGHYERPGGA